MTKYQKYKLAIISLLSITFIYVYSEKNRYTYSKQTEDALPIVLDTKTGKVYFIGSKRKFDIKKGLIKK